MIAVVLAAGRSTRLGRPKLMEMLLPGVTVLDTLLARLVQMGIQDHVVVTRPDVQGLPAVAARYGGKVVLCASDAQSVSVRAGIEAAAGAAAWLVLLGDQPLVSSRLVELLSHRIAEGFSAAAARVPTIGVRPPVAFAAAARDSLMALNGDQGARVLLQQMTSVGYVDYPAGPWLLDADTEADLEGLRAVCAGALRGTMSGEGGWTMDLIVDSRWVQGFPPLMPRQVEVHLDAGKAQEVRQALAREDLYVRLDRADGERLRVKTVWVNPHNALDLTLFLQD